MFPAPSCLKPVGRFPIVPHLQTPRGGHGLSGETAPSFQVSFCSTLSCSPSALATVSYFGSISPAQFCRGVSAVPSAETFSPQFSWHQPFHLKPRLNCRFPGRGVSESPYKEHACLCPQNETPSATRSRFTCPRVDMIPICMLCGCWDQVLSSLPPPRGIERGQKCSGETEGSFSLLTVMALLPGMAVTGLGRYKLLVGAPNHSAPLVP